MVLGLVTALLLTAEQPGPADPRGGEVVANDVRPVAKRTTKVRNALRIAKRQIGDPYRYGAEGPGAFDCSGLVYYSTHRAGYRHVPRTSSAQGRYMRHIKRSAMRRGDFVFFTSGGSVYHVGIYAGRRDGHRIIVHAPYTGSHVKRERIWTNSWFPGSLRHR
jgi:cell wall-associated NlpC family hydrolase